MTRETFEKAKIQLERIQYLEREQRKIYKMKERENDSEFNELRSLAYDVINALIAFAEDEFEKL